MPRLLGVKIPILVPKKCPVCGQPGVYAAGEGLKGPVGWIHIAYKGTEEYVCSQVCMKQLIYYQNLRKKALAESKVQHEFVALKDVDGLP